MTRELKLLARRRLRVGVSYGRVQLLEKRRQPRVVRLRDLAGKAIEPTGPVVAGIVLAVNRQPLGTEIRVAPEQAEVVLPRF